MNSRTALGNPLADSGAAAISAISKPSVPFSLGLGALLAISAVVDAGQPLLPVTPVVTGLNNPRGLAFGQDDTLYVAEAGLGAGDGKGGFGKGVGLTGSITEVRRATSNHPNVRTLVTGLVSVGTDERGPQVVGADGISLTREGGLYVIMGESIGGELADDPTLDPDLLGQLGHLLRLTPREQRDDHDSDIPWRAIADVGSLNYAWTGAHKDDPWAPKTQFPDANPYGVLALRGHQYVVDAGANTLNEVRADGTVRILAYIPNPVLPAVQNGPPAIPVSDSVPTCIAQGPDGLLYIGTLAFGANFGRFGPTAPPFWATLPPQSKVYRFNPSTSQLEEWASGFNPITGCGFGRDGSFYVTEFQTQESHYASGDVVRITVNHDGSAGARTPLGVGALQSPNGFACGPDGSIYVSNNSTSTAVDAKSGQVVRVNY